jgi:hypothetical protein
MRKASVRPATWYTSNQLVWYEPSGAVATTDYWNDTSNYAIAYTSMVLPSAIPTQCTLPITDGRAALVSLCRRLLPAQTGTG